MANNLVDDKPPPISQDHYRHIHEQRDFTLENLSMAGDTELMDYEDFKISLQESDELDFEIQELIALEQKDDCQKRLNSSNGQVRTVQSCSVQYRCGEHVSPFKLILN